MWRALRVAPKTSFTIKEMYIRDCFDNFFAVMHTIEHYISTNLIVFEDVDFPFNYLAGKLSERVHVVEAFLKEYEYGRALAFLNRLENWKLGSARTEHT
jgi:hypothetical protein